VTKYKNNFKRSKFSIYIHYAKIGFIKERIHTEIRCTKERIHKKEGCGSTLSTFHSPNPKSHENYENYLKTQNF
jgi:hypothetical protein